MGGTATVKWNLVRIRFQNHFPGGIKIDVNLRIRKNLSMHEFINPMDTVNKLGTQCGMPMDGAGGPTMTTQCDDGYAF